MSNNNEDVMQLLDSLDVAPVAQPKPPTLRTKSATGRSTPGIEAAPGDAAEALAFLDELTQKSNRPTRVLTPGPRVRNAGGTTGPEVRKSIDSVRGSSGTSATPSRPHTPSAPATTATTAPVSTTHSSSSGGGGGWGWGSIGSAWSTASAIAAKAAEQAKTIAEEQAKHLPNEQAKKWSETAMGYVKNAQLDKLGQELRNVGFSTLTELINAVAPPIAEHEVIQIWLSHDMKGYEGVESLVYRALARIMEQVEGGDLVVNRGNESRPAEGTSGKEREMGAVEGLETALKLAAADLEELIKSETLQAKVSKAQTSSEDTKSSNPTTYSSVFLRIQPFFSSPIPAPKLPISEEEKEPTTVAIPPQQLQFVLYLVDLKHNIAHTTITQTVPAVWLEIWDEYDWVEDLVVDVLRVGVEIIGEEYLVSRMGWGKKNGSGSPTPAVTDEKKQEMLDG